MIKHIIVFGDSIAKSDYDGTKNSWVDRLKNISSDYQIFNFSIDGDTTEGVLERFDNNMGEKKADMIVFAIGINDAVYIQDKKCNQVSLDKFKKNVNILIEKSKQLTNKIIFVGLTSVDENLTKPIPWMKKLYCINEEITKYDETIKKICEKENVWFIGMGDILENSDLPDGVHPNEIGHEKMYQRIKDFLIDKKLIKDINEK